MSALLHIELTPGPISRVSAEVAVVAIFSNDRPLRGSAGWADWRLCGQISALIEAGKVTGIAGEALLVPVRGGMRVSRVLALGCGERAKWDAAGQRDFAAAAVSRVRDLGARSLALPFAVAGLSAPELSRRARALVAGAGGALSEKSAEIHLRLIVPRAEVERVDRALRRARPRVQGSVLVRFSEAGNQQSARHPDSAY